MLGRVLDCGCAEQHRALVTARDTSERTDRHPARREGPGLVEHDGVDAARRFERGVPLEEHSEPRPGPRRRNERCGRREPERARASDDQAPTAKRSARGRRLRPKRPSRRASRQLRASRTARSTRTRGPPAAGRPHARSAPSRPCRSSGLAGSRRRPDGRSRPGARRAGRCRPETSKPCPTSTGTDSPVMTLLSSAAPARR